MKASTRTQILFILAWSTLFTGCRTNEYFRQQRIENADRHFNTIQERTFDKEKIFSLKECVKIALANNLDLKAQELKEAVQKERTTAAILGMLPDLKAEFTGTSRNNEPGASSESIKSGVETLEPSKSSEKDTYVTKVDLAFSVIDFGLAYFNSIQSDDKIKLATMYKKRAAQNLIMKVTEAYFKVAATQYVMDSTEKMISLSKKTESTLSKIKKSGNLSSLETIDEKKKILRLEQRLREYRRSYDNACVQLVSLMGYRPETRINVDSSIMNQLPDIDLPSVQDMERLAIEQRPELSQYDIQSDILLMQSRKTIVKMFPNVRIFVDFTNSSNRFLYTHSWWEIGIRAAYNLLRLPAQVKEYQAINKEIDVNDMKTLALSVGIMAQVRISYANLEEVKQRYESSRQINETYEEYLKEAQRIAKTSGNVSELEICRYKMETATTQIDQILELGNYYLAYYRLLNAIGVSRLDRKMIVEMKKRIEKRKKEQAAKKRTAIRSDNKKTATTKPKA